MLPVSVELGQIKVEKFEELIDCESDGMAIPGINFHPSNSRNCLTMCMADLPLETSGTLGIGFDFKAFYFFGRISVVDKTFI